MKIHLMVRKVPMTQSDRSIGKVIRVEWNQEENSVKLVLEITDEQFKWHVLHSKDFEDLISFDGKDVIKIASRRNGD